MTLRLVHIVLLLLLCPFLSAQTVLTGHVKDTDGVPLPNINVLVYKVGSPIIVAHTVSDNGGYYNLSVSIEVDSLDVAASSLFSRSIPNASLTVARRWISHFVRRCRS